MVPVIQVADRPDPRDAILVPELAAERVAGVRRVGDDTACADDVGDLDDRAPLRAGRMDVEVPGHATSLRASFLAGLSIGPVRPVTASTWRGQRAAVRRWRRRSGTPDRVPAEVGEGWIAVDRHEQVGLRQDRPEHVDDAVGAAECGAVDVGAADADRGGAECECLHHVGAGADAGVEKDWHIRHRVSHVSEAVDCGEAAVGLPAAVGGDVDAVDALIDGPAGVVGVGTPLRTRGSVVSERSQARSSQVSGSPNISAQVRIAVPGSSSGDFCSRTPEDRVGKGPFFRQRPRSCGKFEVDKSRGRQPVTQVSRVTTIAR